MNRITDWAIKRNILPHSLKTRLMLSVLLLLGLFIIIFILNNIVLNTIIIRNINQSVNNSINQANLSLTYVFEHAKEQAYQLSAEVSERDDIEKLLTQTEPELTKYEEYDMTEKYISELAKIGLTNRLESIFVYSMARNKLFTTDNGVFRRDGVSDYKWLVEAFSIDGGNALKWIGGCPYLNKQIWSPNSYIISLICRAHIINRNVKSEVFFGLNFNENAIYSIFKDISVTQGSIIYLVDQNGVIISAGDKNKIGHEINEISNAPVFPGNDETGGRLSIDGEVYNRIIINNEITDWNIIALIPEKELFGERWLFWLLIVLLLSFVSLGFILIAYRTIVKFVDKPVVKLVCFMKKVEKGNFKVMIHEERMDEFGALYTGFNEMVSKINVLIRELYQEKLLKRDIELKYLQKLINPHFLYNTLDTIRWLSNENRLADVSQLTLVLSNLYRDTFKSGQDFITLGSCFGSIENYLYIYKVRYGDRFSYSIDAEDDLKRYLILNLVLQPLVENSLIHGIQKREAGGGAVVITAEIRDNVICMRVLDNGIGMRKDKLKIVKASLQSEKNMSDSGLRIVCQRIKLFYGEKYKIRIRSSYRRGTIVSFRFPVFELVNRSKHSEEQRE